MQSMQSRAGPAETAETGLAQPVVLHLLQHDARDAERLCRLGDVAALLAQDLRDVADLERQPRPPQRAELASAHRCRRVVRGGVVLGDRRRWREIEG